LKESDVSTKAFWQSLYEQGRTGWDLGGPTPVFKRVVAGQWLDPGRMIVIGAGRGYDARLFSRQGFQVTAVDFAPSAIRALQENNDHRAPLAVVSADIFDLPSILFGKFDYVLEYTFYCAIYPQRRETYASVVERLLKPGGRFVGLAFPLDETQNDPRGGPPFPVDADELVRNLGKHGLQLKHRERPHDSVRGRLGREELLILQKNKT
jgi:SAM-dependent methyltransferase